MLIKKRNAKAFHSICFNLLDLPIKRALLLIEIHLVKKFSTDRYKFVDNVSKWDASDNNRCFYFDNRLSFVKNRNIEMLINSVSNN